MIVKWLTNPQTYLEFFLNQSITPFKSDLFQYFIKGVLIVPVIRTRYKTGWTCCSSCFHFHLFVLLNLIYFSLPHVPFSEPSALSRHCIKSCMWVACPCSSISIIKHTGSFIIPGLISLRKCWGCGFGRERPPLSRSYDHPFWTETINPVFSHCSVSLKRIFNSPLIDCWKLNACQFERVLQSFKKCSVCKTGWLLL